MEISERKSIKVYLYLFEPITIYVDVLVSDRFNSGEN